MIQAKFEKKALNGEALNDALKLAFPDVFGGFVWDGAVLLVLMSDKATEDDLARVERMVDDHDPSVLSDEQRKQLLEQMDLDARRMQIGDTILDEKLYGDNNLLQELAKRVALLELEVRQLRRD